jgi:nitrite reductase/ring-hydroxylating ferredoxin subunit
MPSPVPIPSAAGKYKFLALHDAVICRLSASGPVPPGAVPIDQDWLVGYSRRCTHMGCKLFPALARDVEADLPGNGQLAVIICPCHSTCFDLARQGMVVIGPATDWLPALKIASDLTIDDAALVKAATGWRVDQGKIVLDTPSGLGVKLYEYQYVENTYAATKLFYQLIGTPNIAFHDRPSVANNTQGFGDSGIDPHG